VQTDDLVSFKSDVPHRITHYTVMAGHSEPSIYVHCCKSIKAEFNLLTWTCTSHKKTHLM